MSSNVNIINLDKFAGTCLFSVTIKKWSARAQVKSMTALAQYMEQLRAEEGTAIPLGTVMLASDRVKSTKALINSPAHKALCARMGEIKKYVLERSMPSCFRAGMFVVKQTEVPKHEQAMKEMVEALTAPTGELEQFLAAYPVDIENARSAPVKKGGLGPLFDADDYPTADELREMFNVEWFWLALSVPENIPAELQAEAGEKFKRRMMDAAEDIESALREEFRTLLEHANDRLTPEPGGEPKVFRNTLIGNLTNFVNLFDAKNVFNDSALEAIVKEARAVLLDDKGTPKLDAQRLRDNKDTRATAKAAFEKMKSALDGMIATKKRRALDLDDN